MTTPESKSSTGANSLQEPVLPRVAGGDGKALAECVQRYGALVWSIARRMSPTAADAEDAVQEVFTQLWSAAASFDAARGPEGAFVALLARRRLIDRRRKRQSYALVEIPVDSETLESLSEVESTAEQHSDAARAARALETLPAEQRRVIVMSLLHGLSHGEIAERTALPLGTVKTLVRRGLLKVREALGIGVMAGESGGVAG